jgi:nitrous oxide reductase accessory protein NosL
MNLNRIILSSLFASLFLSLAACNQMPPIPANQEAPAEAMPQVSTQQVMNLSTPTYQIRNFNDLYNPYWLTDIGQYSSVAVNSAGNPVIAIYDATRNDPRFSTAPYGDGDLKLVVCNDPTCSSTTITTVDRGTTHYTDDVGRYNSMVLDSRGFPIIAYYDQGNGLMLAHCTDTTCTSKSIKKLTGAVRIADISLALDRNGQPVIAFTTVDFGNRGVLSMIRCTNDTCSTFKRPVMIDAALEASLALNRNDEPVISYYHPAHGDLLVATCDSDCSTKRIQVVDSAGDVGKYNSLVLLPFRDPRGQIVERPFVSYYDATNGDLKTVYCGNANCSGGNAIQTLDSEGDVGQYTSLKLSSKGSPVMSYYDVTNGDLKVAICDPGQPLAKVPTIPCQETQRNVIQTVDSYKDIGQYSSLALDANNNPVISYYYTSYTSLRFARRL